METESRGRDDGDDDEAVEDEAGGEAIDAPRGEDLAPGETSARGFAAFRHPWLAASCLCLVAAAAFALLGNFDGAFVAATLGVVAWFLNVRAKLGARG